MFHDRSSRMTLSPRDIQEPEIREHQNLQYPPVSRGLSSSYADNAAPRGGVSRYQPAP
jgi:hypothetical protein